MRVTTKLNVISFVMIATLVLLIPVLIWSFSAVKNSRNRFLLANNIQANFFERSSQRDLYFIYHDNINRIRWEETKKESDRLLRQAKLQFDGKEDQKIIDRLIYDIEDTSIIFHRIVSNIEAMNKAVGGREVHEELNKRLSSQLLFKAAAVRVAVNRLQERSAKLVQTHYRQLAIVVTILISVLALTTLLVAISLVRLIRKRLGPLHLGAKIVADGNLVYRIEIDGTDEFSELAKSINSMTDKLMVEINERKSSEAKVLELNRDFVTLLENTSDFIYFKDESSRFRFCSQSLAHITGHANWRDMIGKHDLEVFPEETALIYCNEELPVFQEGIPLINRINPFYDAQGKKGWVITNKWPVFDSQNKVVGLFGISHEITQLKQAEDEINKLNSDLEQRVQERTIELEKKNADLEKMNKAFIGRELRMVELKSIIKELEVKTKGQQTST